MILQVHLSNLHFDSEPDWFLDGWPDFTVVFHGFTTCQQIFLSSDVVPTFTAPPCFPRSGVPPSRSPEDRGAAHGRSVSSQWIGHTGWKCKFMQILQVLRWGKDIFGDFMWFLIDGTGIKRQTCRLVTLKSWILRVGHTWPHQQVLNLPLHLGTKRAGLDSALLRDSALGQLDTWNKGSSNMSQLTTHWDSAVKRLVSLSIIFVPCVSCQNSW